MEGCKEMNASHMIDVDHVKHVLQSFLGLFNEYSDEIFGTHQEDRLDNLRGQLQRMEAEVTRYLLQIVGDGVIVTGSFGIRQQIAHRDLLTTALMGGNNELALNFGDYDDCVTSLLNRALGRIDAGLWPPIEPEPTLVIRDVTLRQRCFDLLRAPGNFDRVIREATVILEDRIRSKVSHVTLARLIPQSADQSGEKLINKLLSPNTPVIVFSGDKDARVAFHKMLLGINAFLRNPHHHRLDDTVEWSWAWSIVGLIDQLIYLIDNCTTSEP